MTDLLYLVCSAIATQEGAFASNNPGNLRGAPWLPEWVALLVKPKFWQPKSRAQGIACMYHQVALDISRGASLRQLISKWAPKKENDTAAYIAHVAMWCGIKDVDAPLWDLLEIRRMNR